MSTQYETWCSGNAISWSEICGPKTCPVFIWCSAFGPIGLTHVFLLGVFPWHFLCGKGFTPILSPSLYEIRAARLESPVGFSKIMGISAKMRWTLHIGWNLPSGHLSNSELDNDHWNSGFSHCKWWFSIAMLVYQRVYVEMKDMFFSPHLFHLETFSFFFFFS